MKQQYFGIASTLAHIRLYRQHWRQRHVNAINHLALYQQDGTTIVFVFDLFEEADIDLTKNSYFGTSTRIGINGKVNNINNNDDNNNNYNHHQQETNTSSSQEEQESSSESQIINMFEVVLATIETKLQRVENLDRAVHHLMRKMDMMERKLLGKDADIMAAVLDLEKQNSEAHVSVKLNQLSAKLDNLCQHHIEDSNRFKDDSSSTSSDIFVAEPSIR